jgi:hypothetical protein
MAVMDDYKKLITELEAVPEFKSVSDESLDHIAKALGTNYRRIVGLAMLPARSVYLAQFRQFCYDVAAHKILGYVNISKEDFAVHSQKIIDEANQSFPETWKSRMLLSAIGVESEAVAGAINFDAFRDWHTDILDGFPSLFSSIVIGAWTMFEILSTDLWVTTIDLKPNPYAVRFANSADKGEGKSLSIAQMASYGEQDFNIGGMMGRILYTEGKAEFTSLNSTKKAYKRAFGNEISIFNDQQLKLLELVRNLFVHNAGVIDPKFMKDLKESSLLNHPDCTGVELAKPFPLTSEMTVKFIVCSLKSSIALLEFISKLAFPEGHR